VIKGTQDLLDRKDCRENKDLLDSKANRDQQDHRENRVYLESEDFKGLLDRKATKATQVLELNQGS
jgi:hypothetical protein